MKITSSGHFLCVRGCFVRDWPRLRRRLLHLLAFAALGVPAAAVAQVPLGPAAGASASTTLRQDDLRVGLVAYRLALAGSALCPERYPLTGLLFHHLAEYDPGNRPL